MGKAATPPLPSPGSPPLQSGGQNQKWPTCGQSGYVTPAVSGIPTASERGAKSKVAHKWAKWLRHPCRLGDPHRCRAGGGNQKWPTSGQSGYVTPCRLGDPHRFRAGGKIRSGPLVGKVATSPLPSRGSPPLQSGGGASEVAHKWAKWLRHPCRLGDPHRFRAGGKSEVAHLWAKWLRHPCRLRDPHRFRAGGKIRSGPLVGKVAMSPLPSRGSPPLQSGGQNQKWPTSGQSGYVTPAVSGIPTAAERGGKSEVAHKWAKWLRYPLPSRGSPPLQSGGQNQKWPTCGQSGYVTPAVSGIPTASERGGGIRSGPQVGKVATSPLPSRGSPPLQSGGEIRSGPLVGKVATSPLPSRGSPALQSEGGNQKWPTCGQSGYVTPAVSGIPTASEQGAKSEVAHLWAKWLCHPCRLGDPHRFRAGGKIKSGPQVGKVATSPLPSRGSPPLQSGGGNQKWPTSGQSGYVTPCRLGDPHRFRAGGKIRSGPLVGKVATSPLPSRGSPSLQSGGGASEVAHLWAKWLRHPCRLGDPHRFRAGGKSEVAHLWAKWLRHPCRLGDPQRCKARGEIRSGPLVGKVATSPLPSRGSPPLQSGGQNQKWPTCGQTGSVTPAVSGIPTASERGGNQKWPTSGQSGYVTPAVSGIPSAAKRGGKSEVAHLWAKWLRHPCRLGDPHRFRAGGGGSEVAHKWANWLRHPCRLGDPHRCRAGGKIRSGPLVGKVATSPLPSRGSPPLQSGGQNQKWPTCGQSGYVTPAVSGIPTAAERGGTSEVAHKWAKGLCHPCRLGDPHRFRAGGKIRSDPQVGKVAMSPLPSRGSPPLQSGGWESEVAHKWAKWLCHPCRLGDPHRFRAGGKSEVAHLWAKWLCHPCRLEDPHRCRARGDIRSGPQVGKVATSPLPSRGSPPLQSRGQNQKWPTCGQSGSVTPAVLGIPTATERGAKSEVANLWAKWLRHPCRLGDPHRFKAGGKPEVAHLWAKWLRHPCRLGDPHRFRAGGKIRSGPLVGKVAMSPLPSRGSPPLQSGGGGGFSGPQVGKVATSPLPSRGSPPVQSRGQNQKWPTCGQSGYVTPAVSEIPTAAERGAK